MGNKRIELLAPAKDVTTGMAAIRYGADAVYIGANNFGARIGAQNKLEDLRELIQYAHLYHARVYVTLNTILYDEELKAAEKLIHELYDMQVDAIIIQDMGILEMELPPIELHASTQTNNTTPEHIEFLERVGFHRVILARELTIEEIQKIKATSNIELEAFIHGALCVSYSGQCYMSQARTGRSGNRGECAQLCRLPYDLTDEDNNILIKNKHLLSIKDFSAEAHIEDLLDAGICSFKIEGRLKDIGYVKNIVAYYRDILDRLSEKKKLSGIASGTVIADFEPNKYKSFNRGLTPYFLDGRKQKIGTPLSPKSLGEEMGNVIFSNDKKIILKTEHSIHTGDGLCYSDSNGQMKGFFVNSVEGNTIVPHNGTQPPKGATIFRNLDSRFTKKLENSKTTRKINIQFSIQNTEEGILMLVRDEDFIYSEHIIEIEKQVARNAEKNRNSIIQNLNKLGETPYRTESVDFYWSEEYFLPMSVVSEARRAILEKHNKKRIGKHPLNRKTITPNSVSYYKDKADYRLNISNQLAERFYQRHGVEIKEKAFELLQEDKEYNLMTTKYCIRYENNWCPKHHKDAAKIPSPLYIRDQQNYVYQLDFDCKKCVMNIKKVKTS